MILYLKPKKAAVLFRRHPWIFSGALRHIPKDLANGSLVKVEDKDGNILATGHFNQGSIAVRVLAFGDIEVDARFWENRIASAYAKRKALPGLMAEGNDCYRLVHAEGDELPGLIVDVYGDTAVLQCHSVGMHRMRNELAEAIRKTVDGVRYVYDKSNATLPKAYAREQGDAYLGAERQGFGAVVREAGLPFEVNWKTGQKTGFFLDQRESRKLLAAYAPGKSVLNTFCYSGGFSIHALAAGAAEVHSVDVSEKAMRLTEANVALNGGFPGKHHAHTQDVMAYLKEREQQHDIVVVDPPAFAKNLRKRHNAVQGYKRLNVRAMKRVKPGGLLFTFSCSQVVDAELFTNTIVAAAIEAGRPASILHRLSQAPDHPTNLFHPEGSYLKGLVLRLD